MLQNFVGLCLLFDLNVEFLGGVMGPVTRSIIGNTVFATLRKPTVILFYNLFKNPTLSYHQKRQYTKIFSPDFNVKYFQEQIRSNKENLMVSFINNIETTITNSIKSNGITREWRFDCPFFFTKEELSDLMADLESRGFYVRFQPAGWTDPRLTITMPVKTDKAQPHNEPMRDLGWAVV